MIETLLQAFITLFVTIDPPGIIPIFLALTANTNRSHQFRMALYACIIAAIILLLFGLFGELLLGLFGITLPAFRVAGGALLFLLAVEMLFAKRADRRSKSAEAFQHDEEHTDISAFPLAIPLISGPGAITSIMLIMADHSGNNVIETMILGIMLLVILLTFLLFWLSILLERFISPVIINIITRLLGMVLAALSIQYIFDGIKTGFF